MIRKRKVERSMYAYQKVNAKPQKKEKRRDTCTVEVLLVTNSVSDVKPYLLLLFHHNHAETLLQLSVELRVKRNKIKHAKQKQALVSHCPVP